MSGKSSSKSIDKGKINKVLAFIDCQGLTTEELSLLISHLHKTLADRNKKHGQSNTDTIFG